MAVSTTTGHRSLASSAHSNDTATRRSAAPRDVTISVVAGSNEAIRMHPP